MAVVKGYSRGLIIAVVSFLAIVIGLAAAIKLSAIVAGWLETSTNISSRWLPFVSFAIIMLVVIILLRWLANMLQAAASLAFLGWINKLGGIILYAFIYSIIYGILLFYGTQMHLIKQEAIENSKTYSFIQPLGYKVVDSLGSILPFFKNMFYQLENFFEQVAQKPQP